VTAIVAYGSDNGMARLTCPIDALLGVFLDDGVPLHSPPPSPPLTFDTASARDFLVLRPALRQPFYIGSGSTSGGVAQQFVAPNGATRLFLGVMDAYGWNDNVGGFTVTVARLPAMADLASSAASATTPAHPPAQATVPNPAASHEPGWISSQVPKPGADGWIVLFDGKRLYGCSPPAADLASGKVSIQDGCLRLDTITLDFNLIGRDVAIRARLKKASGANCDFAARNDGKNNGKGRDCEGCFNQANNFFLGHHVDQQWRSVMTVRPQGNYLAFFEMEFRAEGENLTLKADGQDICHTRENSIMEAGTIAVRSLDGITLYQSIEAQLLDKR